MNLKYLLCEKPTIVWKERMIEYGDDLFTEEILELCDQVLSIFINKLEALDQSNVNRDQEILEYIKQAVIAFNELNDENDYFIETMEREELAEFIDNAARAAGLTVEKGFDITEEWREW